MEQNIDTISLISYPYWFSQPYSIILYQSLLENVAEVDSVPLNSTVNPSKSTLYIFWIDALLLDFHILLRKSFGERGGGGRKLRVTGSLGISVWDSNQWSMAKLQPSNAISIHNLHSIPADLDNWLKADSVFYTSYLNKLSIQLTGGGSVNM